jgi:DNA replication and repair protein RecF
MKIDKLQLSNFKNYEFCSFQFNSKLNFIFGDNGNGKTNILEAISMLCYTRSFLQTSDDDCIKYGFDEFDIKGEFINAINSRYNVEYKFGKDFYRKKILLDDENISGLSLFFGRIPLVVLSPGDIKITLGSPADRRRNFDILISQISRVYYDDLKNLNRLLKQKNSLLREHHFSRKYSATEIKDLLDGWNKELIDTGIKIIIRRLNFVKEFQNYMTSNFKNILGDTYKPCISYESELLEDGISESINESFLREKFERAVEMKSELELKRGISLVGPQRDDYLFRMEKQNNTFELKTFASQGEHKTFIVALKLSEYVYLRDKLEIEITGEPLLLLDDLFSELDRNRTQKISWILTDYNQVFLTTTEVGYLQELKKIFGRDNVTSFNIINGTAKAIQ